MGQSKSHCKSQQTLDVHRERQAPTTWSGSRRKRSANASGRIPGNLLVAAPGQMLAQMLHHCGIDSGRSQPVLQPLQPLTPDRGQRVVFFKR